MNEIAPNINRVAVAVARVTALSDNPIAYVSHCGAERDDPRWLVSSEPPASTGTARFAVNMGVSPALVYVLDSDNRPLGNVSPLVRRIFGF